MNLFNNINHIYYFFNYRKQNQNRFKQKFRRNKSNSHYVFDTKLIANLFFKVPLWITFENGFDFKKLMKSFKSKNHVYKVADDEKKIDYYKFTDEKELNNNLDANFEAENLVSNLFDQNSFVKMLIAKIFKNEFKNKFKLYRCKNIKFFLFAIIDCEVIFENNANRLNKQKPTFITLKRRKNLSSKNSKTINVWNLKLSTIFCL